MCVCVYIYICICIYMQIGNYIRINIQINIIKIKTYEWNIIHKWNNDWNDIEHMGQRRNLKRNVSKILN